VSHLHKKFFDQIVIGNGSSAFNFLHSALEGSNAKFKSKQILIIGKSDLWSRTKPDHAMGQPPELLQRQLGNQRYPTVGEMPRLTGLEKTRGNTSPQAHTPTISMNCDSRYNRPSRTFTSLTEMSRPAGSNGIHKASRSPTHSENGTLPRMSSSQAASVRPAP
jgi:hypothetical protein